MRTAPAGLQAWLAANNIAWRADLITLTVLDGTVYRWTTADGDLAYSGNLFRTAGPFGPVIQRSGYNNGCRLVVDTLDIALTGGGYQILGKPIPQQGVLGYFDGARVKVDHAIGAGPNQAIAGSAGGVIGSFFEGLVAQVEPKGPALLLRCKSEIFKLNQLLPKFPLQPQCGNAVYDANCGLSKAAFTVVGAADGSPTTRAIHTSSAAVTAHGAGYYNLGVLKFTSGKNNQVKRAVQSWDGATFTMALPFPVAPAAGDTFTVYPGCNKSASDCTGKFNNNAQNRGFRHIPAPEAGSN